MIFASDSRTNAGVDNIAKFCKMTVFERRGDRVIVLLSSGSLAGTQAVIGVLNKRCAIGDTAASLWGARTMFDVAMLVADAVRDIERRDGEYLQENEIGFNASFIVGGQISGEPLRLFRIYAEGNFIEAGIDTPYFQTGAILRENSLCDNLTTTCGRSRERPMRFGLRASAGLGNWADIRPKPLQIQNVAGLAKGSRYVRHRTYGMENLAYCLERV